MMMPLHLDIAAQSEVLALPESGMGFQHLSARYQGRAAEFLVLNGELAFELSELGLRAGTEPAVIDANGSRVLNALRAVSASFTASWAPSHFTLLTARVSVTPIGSSGTMIAPTSSLVKPLLLPTYRPFHRYSAFKSDRRINSLTGDFLPGTYATTESEVPFVPTGFVAVGRFALPNTLPASYRYTILAPAGTYTLFGTVAPAFGQSGGGVEAFFPNGVVNQFAPPIGLPPIPDE